MPTLFIQAIQIVWRFASSIMWCICLYLRSNCWVLSSACTWSNGANSRQCQHAAGNERPITECDSRIVTMHCLAKAFFGCMWRHPAARLTQLNNQAFIIESWPHSWELSYMSRDLSDDQVMLQLVPATVELLDGRCNAVSLERFRQWINQGKHHFNVWIASV